ncbi:MAG: hypothetical protein IAE97_04445 [Chthoniobacterales bacterium]|nr:hypothetical protein [Chthoniobacterales bacterium]
MNWFKANPFIGGLAVATAALVLVAGYLLLETQARYSEQATLFEGQKATLEQLQRNKPFPNEANVRAMQAEHDEALEILKQIGETVRVDAPATTPQGFQDVLRSKVSDITANAQKNGVTLGDNFYLGFEEYETKLPSAEAAPQLALQLASIHNVASILIDSKVRGINSIHRMALPGESTPESPGRGTRTRGSGNSELPDLRLAPFEVNFEADQSHFHMAFNRILEAKPSIFVRLVGVTNSSPQPPKKDGEEDVPASDQPSQSVIRPVVGQEHLIINLQLASISASGLQAGK